jgi:hypothetical protein
MQMTMQVFLISRLLVTLHGWVAMRWSSVVVALAVWDRSCREVRHGQVSVIARPIADQHTRRASPDPSPTSTPAGH